MKNSYTDDGIRERLIIAGIKEIELHGLNDFSLRRVAAICEVSCAAPYRHYKNKDELILSIIAYINSRWNMMADQIVAAFSGDSLKQLKELSVAIVRFLIANPNYLSIMLPLQSGMNIEQQNERDKFWNIFSSVFEKVASEKSYNINDRERLEFRLRSLVIGTVILLEGCSADKCKSYIDLMREELSKILDAFY